MGVLIKYPKRFLLIMEILYQNFNIKDCIMGLELSKLNFMKKSTYVVIFQLLLKSYIS